MTLISSELDLPADHPLRQIMDTVTAHPEVREPLLRVLLTEDFLRMPSQMKEVQERVANLESSFEDFREETREQFRVVNERLDTVDKRLDENNREIRSLRGSVGHLRGDSYENLCQAEIAVILDGWLEWPVVADREHISTRLGEQRHGGLISRQDYLDGLRPDIIARAKKDDAQTEMLAVVEVSITFNREDLATAARRAQIIGQVTGVRTRAFVVTHYAWPDEMDEVARQMGVTLIRHESPKHAEMM